MDGENGERGREGARAKGHVRGRRLHYRRTAFAALTNHGEGGLHRHHGAIRGFVGARADIEHGVGVAESVHDRSGDTRIRTAVRSVAAADLVVELRRGHPST